METEGVKVVANDLIESNKPGKWKAKFSVADRDGKMLKAGTDYDNKNVLFCYDDTYETPIPDDAEVVAGTTVYVKVNAAGPSYTGEATGSYRIIAEGHDIGKLTASVEPKDYTGRPITISPGDITWKSGRQIISPVDFVIDPNSYKNNINKGKAKVTVYGTGEWGGRKEITFRIGNRNIHWWDTLFQ